MPFNRLNWVVDLLHPFKVPRSRAQTHSGAGPLWEAATLEDSDCKARMMYLLKVSF